MHAPAFPIANPGARTAPVPAEAASPPDDDLARRAQAGDATALELLARRYRGRVYVFALSLLQRPEDAEDAVQETLVRACRGLAGYRPRGHFRTWLYTIAANVCRAHRSREGRHAVSAAPEAALEAVAAPADPFPHRTALREAVRAAIGRLPSTYRAPVVLHYLEDLPVAEVAAVLGRTRPAVKVQLWRARAFLARELQGWLD